MKTIILIGAPVDAGKRRQGCRMGPDAYRVAGLQEALTDLGHSVQDQGDVHPEEDRPARTSAPFCPAGMCRLDSGAQPSCTNGRWSGRANLHGR